MDKLGDAFLDFNLNETAIDDQNLNAVWVELDRGLLSDNTGQQCESILKLTELFDKYPLPVFVNSGFLRLARIFQNGFAPLSLSILFFFKSIFWFELFLNIKEQLFKAASDPRDRKEPQTLA